MSKYSNNCFYHVVFTTKSRKKILIKPIKPRIDYWIEYFVKKKNINLVEFKTIINHFHGLIFVREDQSLEKIVQQIKGATSNKIFKDFLLLKLDLKIKSFWNRKYYAKKVNLKDVNKITAYIRNQEKIHAKRLGLNTNIFYDI